ncbi:uncharacterized protein LOC133631488 isoform X4 [Entelurus aequoreus]|uniref:uncharacterized protein LOC133631488 isoform X4 n=1 Tax=Entelurus aequoreus TaxID=161455 RepID=UPI002B1DBB23|nr:uncharacterized protein LOC133631488 isoform X4 [Entelurus aequoreus]XP_061879723.1 uncharacterized protein LOC133631488 isoform X4 [Entelurus aequoreus]XP_061879724.1 uncharacterized protein LOC133631488 isoform X4 [Entelurus aequoreus]
MIPARMTCTWNTKARCLLNVLEIVAMKVPAMTRTCHQPKRQKNKKLNLLEMTTMIVMKVPARTQRCRRPKSKKILPITERLRKMKVEMRKVHATLQDGMVGSWTPPNADFQLTLAELVPHQREAVEAKMRGMAYKSEEFALKTAKKKNRAEMASSLKTFQSAKSDALNTSQFNKRALNAELSVLNRDFKFLKAERAHQIELAQIQGTVGRRWPAAAFSWR